MNTELVAQMFKNYQSNVLFHLEGRWWREGRGGSLRGSRLTEHSLKRRIVSRSQFEQWAVGNRGGSRIEYTEFSVFAGVPGGMCRDLQG